MGFFENLFGGKSNVETVEKTGAVSSIMQKEETVNNNSNNQNGGRMTRRKRKIYKRKISKINNLKQPGLSSGMRTQSLKYALSQKKAKTQQQKLAQMLAQMGGKKRKTMRRHKRRH